MHGGRGTLELVIKEIHVQTRLCTPRLYYSSAASHISSKMMIVVVLHGVVVLDFWLHG